MAGAQLLEPSLLSPAVCIRILEAEREAGVRIQPRTVMWEAAACLQLIILTTDKEKHQTHILDFLDRLCFMVSREG